MTYLTDPLTEKDRGPSPYLALWAPPTRHPPSPFPFIMSSISFFSFKTQALECEGRLGFMKNVFVQRQMTLVGRNGIVGLMLMNAVCGNSKIDILL